jgi:hypothetical protein
MTKTKFTVVTARNVESFLEHALSPVDEVVARHQIDTMLPALHRDRHSLFNWRSGKTLPVYRGRMPWCGVDFQYVRVDDELHILAFGNSPNHSSRTRIDTDLGQPDLNADIFVDENVDHFADQDDVA